MSSITQIKYVHVCKLDMSIDGRCGLEGGGMHETGAGRVESPKISGMALPQNYS